MKNKKFVMFALSLFALALFISSVSAATLTPSSSSLTFTQVRSSQILSFGVNGNTNIPNLNLSINGSTNAVFSITNTFDITTNITTFNITLTSISGNYGLYSVPSFINDTNNTNTNATITLNYIKSFCTLGDLNDSNLSMSVTINNLGTGTKTTWNLLDTIEVKVRLSNNLDTDLNNINLKLGLFNTNGGNVINNVKWISADTDLVTGLSVPSTGGYTYSFKFKLDPSTISNGDYKLMLKAYTKESQLCTDYSDSSDLNDNFGSAAHFYQADISIPPQGPSKAIVVDTSTLSGLNQVSCGQQLILTPTIYNIGPSDNSYSKNQILVVFSNPQLGILQNQTLYGDLNSGSNEQAQLSINVPLNADVKLYPASLTVYYKYNQGNGGYFNDYQYASQSYSVPLQITGGCVYATPDTTGVTAQLVSGGNTGSPLVITATITNKGNKTVTYNFGTEGYSSWATLTGISPSNVTLAPGQSQDITLNMGVNQNANGGNQLFYLDTYSNGYLVTKQPIQVPVTAGFNLSSITGSVTGATALVWGLGILIIVLIVVIIIVAVRLRKK